MTRRETRKEFAYSIGASIAVAFAVVMGLMIENPYQVSVREIVRPLLILTGLAVVGTFFCKAIHRRLMQVFPAAMFAFFQYTGVRELIPQIRFDGAVTVAILSLALTALFIVLGRLKGLNAARFAFLVSGAVAVGTGAAVAMQVFAEIFAAAPPVINKAFATRSLAAVTATKASLDALPDIIYIVPDRYPNRATLRTEYGYDNSDFYRELRARGFVLTEDAWANYPVTFVSLASTLNGGYLDVLRDVYGPNNADRRPVYWLIEHNIVQDRLRQLGYRYLHLGGWWGPTRMNRHADENYLGYPPRAPLLETLPEFEFALVHKTILPAIFYRIKSGGRGYECVRLKRQIQKMRSIGNEPRPVFAFVHMFIPHPPITMDADGTCLARPLYAEAGEDSEAGFIQYLRFFNAQILEIVDEQLRHRATSGRRLIFVIQSDEGPHTKAMAHPDFDGFPTMSDGDLREKMGIINAILLPGTLKADLGSLRTPVNNWRVIFNAVFGAKLGILPDEAFIFRDEQHVFDFQNISQVLGFESSSGDKMTGRWMRGDQHEGSSGPSSADP
jgi:hypothetical protein